MKKFRLSKSCIGEEEKLAVIKVLDKEYLGMGEEVGLLEKELASFLDLPVSREAVCVNTGTAALHLALLALDIGVGDEVLVPSITYLASVQAISATGATPIICEVLEDTVLLDPNDARKRITANTKAIMPVHYASNCYGLESIYELAKEFNLRVIEDAAHSIGSKLGDKFIGSFGDILCFSFDGIKNMTSGEGGAVVTADPIVLQRIKDARLLGVMKDTEKRLSGQRSWFFDVEHQGYRYHMSNIMAAIGREQLKKLINFGRKRREFVSIYRSELADVSGISQLNYPITEVIAHIYVIKITNGLRNQLMDFLRSVGVECGVHYQPNHLLTFYRTKYSLPIAEKLFEELLSLPLHPDLSAEDVNTVCDHVKEFMRANHAE